VLKNTNFNSNISKTSGTTGGSGGSSTITKKKAAAFAPTGFSVTQTSKPYTKPV